MIKKLGAYETRDVEDPDNKLPVFTPRVLRGVEQYAIRHGETDFRTAWHSEEKTLWKAAKRAGIKAFNYEGQLAVLVDVTQDELKDILSGKSSWRRE